MNQKIVLDGCLVSAELSSHAPDEALAIKSVVKVPYIASPLNSASPA